MKLSTATASVGLLFTIASLIFFHPAEAQQQAKIRRIGFLIVSKSATVRSPTVVAFRQGLADLGWVEGQNLLIEYRFAEGEPESYVDLIRELLRANVELLVIGGGEAPQVAKKITNAVPLVMANGGDPVADHVVASLGRPGANITGVASLLAELDAKRLEILRDMAPKISQVDLIHDPENPPRKNVLTDTEAAAKRLGVRLQLREVRSPSDFEEAFQAAPGDRARGALVAASRMINGYRKTIAKLAMANRLPAIFPDRRYVEAGGLVSYGPNVAQMFRRSAFFVDKILKGAKPSDLPVEQPTRLEMVVNLQTAREIDLKIPSEVLMWADEVIK